ncbi:MAG: hypothetical protein KBE42_09990 [Steroidobacteraceae bacterium]|nr:hypothetical protein [Steroidobacteraceae bacterium]
MWREARIAALVALGALVTGTAARADETGIVLTAGEGLAQVRASCVICHSLDYIQMNSPFQDAAGWDRTVSKMIKVMGAPITPEDTAVIVAYLAEHYGKDSPAPAHAGAEAIAVRPAGQ